MRLTNKQLMWIIVILSAAATAISAAAHHLPALPGDLNVSLWIQSFNGQILLISMEIISWLFSNVNILIILVPAMLLAGWRIGIREALLFPLCGIFMLLNEVLKIWIGRPRPPAYAVDVVYLLNDNGFPSGHSLAAFLFLGLINYLIFPHLQNRKLKILILIFSILLVLLVGISRIYLGVHWFSDVIGGYTYGGLFLSLTVFIHRQFKLYPVKK